MTPHMNLERARFLMRLYGLDALLLCSPENFYYSTGYASMIFELYRQAPLAMALFPAEEDVEPAIIAPEIDVEAIRRSSGVQSVYGIPLWWEVYDLAEISNNEEELKSWMAQVNPKEPPVQYDRRTICDLLATIMGDRKLSSGRVGLELDTIDANTFNLLQQANPKVEFIDSTALMYELRSIKTLAEIEDLRQACMLTEAGILAAIEDIGAGTTIDAIYDALHVGVRSAARDHDLTGALGPITGQPSLAAQGWPTQPDRIVGPGTTIKFDVQVCLSHQHSDLGRTFVFGAPTREQRYIYNGLASAHARMRNLLRPGTRICELYKAGRNALLEAGLGRHSNSRGHFGHSVGLDPKIEEPPFISAIEERNLAPGMVLALETPFYGAGLGVFQLEDLFLIASDGCEALNKLPRDLIQLG
ncbi:MAG: aminopeptidase P family protein [Anaerolineales bacterium]|nr:aminopeptidase P family protein [Anaerolineales bacterium]